MKKISIMLTAALALGFVACDNYEEPNPAPQTNEQESLVSADSLVVAPGAAVAAGAIDLAALNAAEENVAVLNFVEFKGLPADNEMQFVMQIDGEENFTSPQDVAVTMVENVAYVTPADWQAAHLAEFGKNPKARETYIRFAAYAANGNSKVRIGDADFYVGSEQVSVTPFAAPFFIDEVYNLEANGVVVAQFNGTGGDVYDNPNFKTLVNIAIEDFVEHEEWGEAWAWRIVAVNAAEGTERTVFAPTEDYWDSFEGDLATNAEGVEPAYGNFPVDGKWIFTFNPESLKFKIEEAPDMMYMIGGFCGWDWAQCAEMIRVNGHEGLFWTIRYVNAGEGFKFNSITDWGGDFGFYGATVESSAAGEVAADKDGNFVVPTAGWYIFVIDNSTGSPVLSVLEPNVYVFGDAAGGSWSADDKWKFQIVGDRDAEWPFVSPEVMTSNALRLCIQLPGCEWWQSEFIFYEDGNIQYRADGGDQARIGNPAGKVYLNFVTGKGKVE